METNKTMDNLKAMVGRQQQSESKQPLQKETSKVADWIWARMAEIYGETWMRERGALPPSTWIAAIGLLSKKQVLDGVERVALCAAKWPPNLPEFIAYCKNIDTDAAFDRMIKGDKPLGIVEKKTRQECGFACKRQLPADKARTLFAKVYSRWQERFDSGTMPDESVNALPKHSQTKSTDHMVEERMRGGKAKTDIELRLEAILSKRTKV